MRKAFILLSILFAVNRGFIYSQIIPTNSVFQNVNVLEARKENSKLDYSAIQGSPYYSDVYVKSTVFLTDSTSGNASLRYDLFLDEIECAMNNKTFWLNKKNIRKIQLGDEWLIVSSVPEENNKLAYLFVQNSGNYQLIIRKRVEFLPLVPPKAYGQTIPDRFERVKDELYLRTPDQSLHFFKSKKELLSLLGSTSEITDFFSKEKIRIENIPSLKKLMDFINMPQK
jgi:hypothetical protein